MARKPRVEIPKNPKELMALTGNVYKEHTKQGTKSPLLILDSPTWDELGPEVETTLATQNRIEELEHELKTLYGERDPLLEKFTDLDRRSRDILLAKYASNPAMLGTYGYDVIEAHAPKPKTPKP